MTDLQTLEHALQDYILKGDERLLRSNWVKTPISLSPEGRSDIYRTAYQVRLLTRLAEDFPNVQRLLGEANFSMLAASYIERYPASEFSIREFGKQFADFLATLTSVSAPALSQDSSAMLDALDEQLALLPTSLLSLASELAAFEWAMGKAMDAADAPALDLAALQAVPMDAWPSLRFNLHPSVQILSFYHEVIEVWEALEAGQSVDDTLKTTVLAEPTLCLVWRQGVDLARYQQLETVPGELLAGIQAGEDFQQLCLRLCAHLPEETVAAQIIGVLQAWLAWELLI